MPSEFIVTDRHGRKWDIALTLGAAQRVDRSDFTAITDREFSILEPKQDLFQFIFARPAMIGAIAFAIVEPQVARLIDIDPTQKPNEAQQAFVDSFDGDALKRLKDTLWRSFADFFPDQRTVLLELAKQLENASLQLTKKMEEMLPEVQRAVDEELTKGVEEIRRGLQPGATSGG